MLLYVYTYTYIYICVCVCAKPRHSSRHSFQSTTNMYILPSSKLLMALDLLMVVVVISRKDSNMPASTPQRQLGMAGWKEIQQDHMGCRDGLKSLKSPLTITAFLMKLMARLGSANKQLSPMILHITYVYTTALAHTKHHFRQTHIQSNPTTNHLGLLFPKTAWACHANLQDALLHGFADRLTPQGCPANKASNPVTTLLLAAFWISPSSPHFA